MIKKNKNVLIITSLVILLPALVGLILWSKLPEQLPMHWNVAGEVDDWGSKTFVVLGLPLILLAGQWVCVLATLLDPKQKNHTNKLLHLAFWIIPVLSILVCTLTYLTALGITVKIEVVMPVFMGLVFIIIGNFLPKCKQNYTIGIKIPWTLDSETNWNKTHRFAGRLWVICGLLITLTAFLGIFWLPAVMVLPMVILPIGYSYLIYRKEKAAEE